MIVATIVILLGLLIGGAIWYCQDQHIIIPVNLTQEEQKDYEQKVQDYEKKIQTETDPEDSLKRPYMDHFLEKARYETYLGRLSEAEKTLRKGLSHYETSSAAHHNLAKIYEKMGKNQKAIKEYLILANEYRMQQYLLDAARAAIVDNDYKNAFRNYWDYQKVFKTPDITIEDWLRKNKKS